MKMSQSQDLAHIENTDNVISNQCIFCVRLPNPEKQLQYDWLGQLQLSETASANRGKRCSFRQL